MGERNRYVKIGRPYIEKLHNETRLCSWIEMKGQKQLMWFSVHEQYGEYLTDDRADAFVVALLTTAMRNGEEIVCEAPITKRLHYQLIHYLIPAMSANMEEYHCITIQAGLMDSLSECAGAVGTGWTGGVDSMYTLFRSLETDETGYRLTHLMITSNGALEEKNNSDTLKRLVKAAEEGIASELNLKVIGIDTNLQDILPEKFLAVSSFRHAAVILSLQKLFKIFLCSASYEFSKFSFDAANCSYYEMMSLNCFETGCTRFYPAYGAFSRAQKLMELSDFPTAYKYLHPCIKVGGINCGKCGKCIRTEAVLYSLGTLKRFSAVFDTDEFERNKDWYLAHVLAKKRSQHYGEALALLRQHGIETSEDAKRMARILCAAETVVDKNKSWLSKKLIGE